jgi:CheY-like chemotaxis protein
MLGKKLLVADDSLTIQKVIRLALSNEGYDIQAVADGNDAINQILLFRPNVVLIDVSLPGKNAFEVKQEVNEHEDLAETRFVLISSAFEKVDEQQAEEVIFHGRLTKPFDPAHLRNVLTSVLAQVTSQRLEPTAHIQVPSNLPPLPPGPPVIPSGELHSEFVEEDLPSLPVPPTQKHKPNPSPPSSSSVATEPNAPDLPPMLPEDETSDQTDIQRLTESTMRISGIDDYQWSMKEPSIRPPSLMNDSEETTFRLDEEPPPPIIPRFTAEDLMPPPTPDFSSPSDLKSSDLRSSLPVPTLSLPESDLPSNLPESPSEPISIPPPPVMPPQGVYVEEPPPEVYPPSSNFQGNFQGNPQGNLQGDLPDDLQSPILASEEKIDVMIHNQIEATLEKMIQKALPDIAEKLIKEEIHKLLSE